MTDPAIIAASYAAERNYSHNPDDVIDPSGAVLVIGTEKLNTTTLKDRSLNGNDGTIHDAMPTEGFIQGRRFDGDGDYLDCGNSAILGTNPKTLSALVKPSLMDINWHTIYKEGTYSHNSMLDIGISNNKYAVSQHGLLVSGNIVQVDMWTHICVVYNGTTYKIYENGVETGSGSMLTNVISDINYIGRDDVGAYWNGTIICILTYNRAWSAEESESNFNTLARLPFWSVNYIDYPDNVTEYTDNLPYSSSIISSGTFKVDDDKLHCVSAGTITYSASYDFDGSEYIKVQIDGVEYAGTGTITQGNTTVSVAQGSNKVTIQMGTGDTIDGDGIDIQFRECV